MMAGREGEGGGGRGMSRHLLGEHPGPAASGTCKKIKRKKRSKESGSRPGYHHL